MKLEKLFDQIIITQSGHSKSTIFGKPVNETAFDFSHRCKMLAPDNCEIKYKKINGEYSEFVIELHDGSRIYVLHALPVRTGKFKLGDLICDKPISMAGGLPDHYHVAIFVNGKWDWVLNYIRRDAPLSWWTLGGTHVKWTNWSSYPDEQLEPILPITQNEMVTFKKPILIKTNNTSKLNIREASNSSSKDLGDVLEPTEFWAVGVENGQMIDGENRWYKVAEKLIDGTFKILGFIFGAFVDEIQVDTSDLQKQINDLKIRLADSEIAYKEKNDLLLESSLEVNRLSGELSQANEKIVTLLNKIIKLEGGPQKPSIFQNLINFILSFFKK